MSQRLLGGIIAALILVLTAIVHVATTSSLEQGIRKDMRLRVERARQQLIQNASLQGLRRLKQVEALASDPSVARAMKAGGTERTELANLAFQRFVQGHDEDSERPDILGLTDATGDLVALLGVENPLPGAWKQDGELKYPAIAVALDERILTSDIWSYEREGLMEVGVAPVLDPATDKVLGALVMAYAVTAQNARDQETLLGASVAYFHNDAIFATSFARAGDGDKAGDKGALQAQLGEALLSEELGRSALEQGVAAKVISLTIAGDEYVVTAGRLPRFSSRPLPDKFPAPMAGALVMMSVSGAMAPLGTIRVAIWVLGAAGFVFALLAVAFTSRRIMQQVDALEDNIHDILAGQGEPVIHSVGPELDGVAHGMGVMLARLLGQPDPGTQDPMAAYGGLSFDDEDQLSAADTAAMALAEEPEDFYYRRLYGEYMAARRQVGEPVDSVTYETLVAKLRANESQLKIKYQCSAVRFRVVVRDGKVTLKPVPII